MNTIEVVATGNQNTDASQFLGVEDWVFRGTYDMNTFKVGMAGLE